MDTGNEMEYLSPDHEDGEDVLELVAPSADPVTETWAITVPSSFLPVRVDKYLLDCPGLHLSRAAINSLFQDNAIKINGKVCKKGNKVCFAFLLSLITTD